MELFQYYPDLELFCKNYALKGKILNWDIEKQLKEIYDENSQYEFFVKNLIPIDMMIKELIQNSIKANMKRWIFKRYHLDPFNELDYQKSLRILKHIMYFLKIEDFENKVSDFDFYYYVFLSFHPKVLIIHVLNEGGLLPIEEKRIRNKFQDSVVMENLYEFYVQHSDSQEGSGMGIAIIIMLLRQMGLHERNFSIFSLRSSDLYSNSQNFEPFQKEFTVSRVYIPLKSDYIYPRYKFDVFCKKHCIEENRLRELLHKGNVYIPFL